MPSARQRILGHLKFLYGDRTAANIWLEMEELITEFSASHPEYQVAADVPLQRLTERDMFLITYADQITSPSTSSLACLRGFLDNELRGVLEGVHLLPFYPYSSDDGFAVIDYFQVDRQHGNWLDIKALGEKYRLMFDAVINHISKDSDWFQGYLEGQENYRDFFIELISSVDLSQVVRPRALPLLTSFKTARGLKHVWTTFGPDQIDLNYANPQVLLAIVRLLLFYVSKGAEVLRLDAIAYLWKEVGTSSIHLPQTHRVVKLFRAILDELAPQVILITETNVPHKDNISYFGESLDRVEYFDEAQMVYQFPLAPLVLHTFIQEDAEVLSAWAATLETPSPSTTFFNFTASHDGIGLMPAMGLLDETEIQAIVDQVLAHGGYASNKSNADGTQSVYELNVTFYDALNNPRQPQEKVDNQRFMASQAIMLVLAGVPGIYIHSLLGSRNCQTCVSETNRSRSINRQKFDLAALRQILTDPLSIPSQILAEYLKLIEIRKSLPAFHPNAAQQIINFSPSTFSVLRVSLDKRDSVLAITNISPRVVDLNLSILGQEFNIHARWRDLITDQDLSPEKDELRITLAPYQYMWLRNRE